MSFPRYPKYKDSGVEWLGDVPEHWEVRRLKFLCNIQTGDKDTENAVEDGEYPFFVRSQTVERINSHTFDCEAILTAGDGVGVGKVFHYYKGKFDFHQRVYMMNEFRDASGKFLFHFLRENFYKVALEGGAKSTVDSLRRPLFTNFPVVLPTEAEQESISQFVETEASRIDSLVVEQRRLIELLKEKRQAVISHAVTKGLNPHAPMKPSGIEWLGDVPEHWELVRIKHVAFGFMYGTSADCNSEDSGTPVLRIPNVKDGFVDFTDLKFANFGAHEEEKYLVHDGDILVVRTNGSPELVGKSALFRGDLRCMFASYLIKIRPKAIISPEFLILVMNAACTREMLTLTARTSAGNYNMNCEGLGQTHLMLPSLVEQDAIVAALNGVLAEFDALISEVERAIELLQERRTALISATVTGRIDVRGLA